MTFLFEQDDLPVELRVGYAGTVQVVPKVNGSPVDAADLSTASWSVVERDGEQVSSGTATVVSAAFGDRTVGYYVVTIPAIDEIDENYILTLTWDAGVEVLTFDVVHLPLGELVSVNDIQRQRAEASEYLTRIGRRHGETDPQRALEAGARSITVLARQALHAMLVARADADGRPRGAQVLDRRALARVETLVALREMFGATANAPIDGDDTASELYRHYNGRANEAFESMRVAYVTNEDEIREDGATSFGRSYQVRRVQA